MTHALTDPDLIALLSDTLTDSNAHGAVVCLCADWCGTCREYAQVFEALQQALPAHRYRWIDIEDEADALGDIDVETFPTLVIGGRDGAVRFAGPVLPQPGQIARLLQSLGL